MVRLYFSLPRNGRNCNGSVVFQLNPSKGIIDNFSLASLSFDLHFVADEKLRARLHPQKKKKQIPPEAARSRHCFKRESHTKVKSIFSTKDSALLFEGVAKVLR